MIKKPDSGMKLYGPTQTKTPYCNTDPGIQTRYASLHGLQAGAEFNEVQAPLASMAGEIANNWGAMNIISGCNQTDLPSRFGEQKYGLRKIGGLVFTPQNDYDGWLRNKGESK